MDGIRSFLEKIVAASAGTFHVEAISMASLDDDFVVLHNQNRRTLLVRF